MTTALRKSDGEELAIKEHLAFDEPSGDVVLTRSSNPESTSARRNAAVTAEKATAERHSSQPREGLPAADWDLCRLGQRADFEGKQITGCEIEAAPHYWIIGMVMRLAKPSVDKGHWGHWLKAHGIDANRAFRARRLAAAFASLDQLDGLTLREAMKLAMAKRGVTTKEVKRNARRTLIAMSKTLLSIQDDVKTPEDRASLLPSLDQVEQTLAALRRAWN